MLDIKQTCDCMPRIVADNAPSEDDEDDDTATVDYEQELRWEPREDPAQELQERKKKELELEQEQGDPKPQAVQFNLLAAAKAYSQKMECTGKDFAIYPFLMAYLYFRIFGSPFIFNKLPIS